jgi:hypothetical protein
VTRRRIVPVLILLLCTGVIVFIAVRSGDSSSGKPDGAACKAAMQKQFDYGMAHPDAPAGVRPAACEGISDADLQRYVSEIMDDYMRSGS